MKSSTMKVLHPIGGRSMLGHVLHAVEALHPRQVVTVVGHQRGQVGPHAQQLLPSTVLAVQETQEGTGHAVRVAADAARVAGAELGGDGTVLVCTGDTPLLRGETLAAFVASHAASDHAVSILTGSVPDPHGYGRIVREGGPDDTGRQDVSAAVAAIVEEKECTEAQRRIDEINSGILAFDAAFLRSVLPRLRNDNAKEEYYLTDAVALARADGHTVGAHRVEDVGETEGANDRAQLAKLGRLLNERVLETWMKDGVTVVDPTTTWVDVTVRLEADVTLLPGTQLHGATTVATGATVGPGTTLRDVVVGAGAGVVRTHAEGAEIGEGASVGPFSYLRPGTRLAARSKIGAYVETKNASLGEGSKVPHLSYVGDAEIGDGSNIGAGTVFANYDGHTKHRTVVGDGTRTGSNNTFVAPVRIGDGAMTGGGTVVREDVPDGALAVSAGPLRIIEGWVAKRRARRG
ncbi:bifunctional UDP-N-acetylglucosamine diphosphorylase/glucosamine-1-phosphate N-acetyltransferase GlmU [Nocardioidaceae bacterium]|nr:bifunctional UDP-N-acetylglucosamine diphosphorylase/glucosamine-1-phosphate N-acetyltransferase GlmU [Nocardioidaceae bacterium]